MSTSSEPLSPSWEERENQNRLEQGLKFKAIFNWLLILAVIILGFWVLILKLSHEPGIHLHLFNETGLPLKDVSLKFTWSEYVMPELPTTPSTQRQVYYGAIIQKVVWMDDKASVLTITWTDDKGVKHQHIEKDMYLTGKSELIIVTFSAKGNVTVKYRGLGFL